MLFDLALILVDGVGPIAAKSLLATCGSAEQIFAEKSQHLLKIPGIGTWTVKSIKNAQTTLRAEQELNFITKNNIEALRYTDSGYPNRLKYCEDGPILLFKKGKSDLNCERTISVVGTRRVSDYGAQITKEILAGLSPFAPLVVSGLALGVDSLAHRYALEYNCPTVATLAHGLDRIYPALNRQLAENIMENGALVTEFFSGSIPDRENFPARNRIVAGMSSATIVIETLEKGGSMITANLAFDYSRDVFAVPGRLIDKSFAGCNRLIAQNKASIIVSVDELVKQLGWADEKTTKNIQQSLFHQLNPDEQLMVDYLRKNGSVTIDTIALGLGFTTSKTNALLMQMELMGLLRVLPGKKVDL